MNFFLNFKANKQLWKTTFTSDQSPNTIDHQNVTLEEFFLIFQNPENFIIKE